MSSSDGSTPATRPEPARPRRPAPAGEHPGQVPAVVQRAVHVAGRLRAVGRAVSGGPQRVRHPGTPAAATSGTRARPRSTMTRAGSRVMASCGGEQSRPESAHQELGAGSGPRRSRVKCAKRRPGRTPATEPGPAHAPHGPLADQSRRRPPRLTGALIRGSGSGPGRAAQRADRTAPLHRPRRPHPMPPGHYHAR